MNETVRFFYNSAVIVTILTCTCLLNTRCIFGAVQEFIFWFMNCFGSSSLAFQVFTFEVTRVHVRTCMVNEQVHLSCNYFGSFSSLLGLSEIRC